MDAETELVAKLEKDRRHSRRVMFGWVVTVIALPVTGVICAYCYDCAPPEDGDMRPQWTTVPVSENGLGQFQEWLERNPVKAVTRSDETDLSKPTWKPDAAGKLVAEFQPALDEFDKLAATDITKWRYKEGAALARFTASLAYLTPLQSLATVTRHRARILLAEGRPAEAAALGFELMRVGRGLQAEGALIHHLVAVTIQAMGQTVLAETMKSFPDYVPDHNAWRSSMRECEPRIDAASFALKTDYEAVRNLMSDVRTGTVSRSALSGTFGSGPDSWVMAVGLRPNRTLRLYLDVQKPVVEAAGKDWGALAEAGRQQTERLLMVKGDGWKLTQAFLRGNPGGEMLVVMAIPAFQKLSEKYYINVALHRVTFTQLAIREHELVNHRLPASLGDLVPARLPSVPVDPFDGKPLRWDVAKKILYSVGPDMSDDAGDINDEKPAKGKDAGMNYWWANSPSK
jgi:hypothetical protein